MADNYTEELEKFVASQIELLDAVNQQIIENAKEFNRKECICTNTFNKTICERRLLLHFYNVFKKQIVAKGTSLAARLN